MAKKANQTAGADDGPPAKKTKTMMIVSVDADAKPKKQHKQGKMRIEAKMAQAQALYEQACDLIDAGHGSERCLAALEAVVQRLRPLAGLSVAGVEEMSAANPDYLLASVYLEQGKLLEDGGRYEAAKDMFGKAVDACAHAAGPRVHLAKMLHVCAKSQADTAAAEEQYDTALAIASKVLAHGQQGRYDPAFEVELTYGTQAQDGLALLLAQEGRDKEARTHMTARGFTWRLGRDVLHYPDAEAAKAKIEVAGAAAVMAGSADYVRAVDNVLPPAMLAHMQQAFGKDSPFWAEHNYGPNTPYFSYLHSLDAASKDRSSLDQVIHHLWAEACRQYPATKKAKYAEWWAHCRPHAHGHQLHFDSDDEGRSRAGGKPRHPITGTVLYLSGAHVGGPTLVTNQVLGESLADKGWLMTPRENRYCMFEGSVLHGVVPGRGNIQGGVEPRRVTFMVAFWGDIKGKANQDGSPGSAQPFPYAYTPVWELKKYAWAQALAPQRWPQQPQPQPQQSSVRVCPTPVDCAWQPVRPKKQADKKRPKADSSSGPLPLPRYEQCFQGF